MVERGCTSSVAFTSTSVAPFPSETTTVEQSLVLAAVPIVIAWASSDLDSFTPKSAPLRLHPASSTATQTVNTPPSPATQTTGPANSNPGLAPAKAGSTLSTGAKAGISVGIGIAVLAALVAGVWLFVRHKRKSRGTAGAIRSHSQAHPSSSRDKGNEGAIFEPDSRPVRNVHEFESSSYAKHYEGERFESDSRPMRNLQEVEGSYPHHR